MLSVASLTRPVDHDCEFTGRLFCSGNCLAKAAAESLAKLHQIDILVDVVVHGKSNARLYAAKSHTGSSTAIHQNVCRINMIGG